MIAELQTAISKVPSRKAQLKGLTQVEAVKIKVERYALLFRGAPVAIGASAINAALTLAVVWSDIDRSVMFGWAGAILLLTALRFSIWWRYRSSRTSARNLSRFARVHVFFMALNGAMWGALGPIFFVYGLIDHAFLPFVVAGTTAVAIVSAGASWRAVLAFTIPALAPLAVVYAIASGPDGFAIAGVVILYGMAMTYIAMTTQRMIDRSILLHTRNVNMFSELQRRVDEANEAEQRFRALVEASQELTIIFSPEGKATYASPSVAKLLNVQPEVVVGLTTKDIVHPDDMALFRAVGEKSLSNLGEVMSLPHVCLKGEGAYVPFSGRLTNMLYVPGVEGFVFSGGLLDEAQSHHIHAAE
ncbi:MAG: PAS domain S-box protein [Marinicaulis sp.]|nr:PAS domain S-box protein [Marinicaulis sp.]